VANCDRMIAALAPSGPKSAGSTCARRRSASLRYSSWAAAAAATAAWAVVAEALGELGEALGASVLVGEAMASSIVASTMVQCLRG